MAKYPEVKLTPKRIAPEEVKIWHDYSAGLFQIGRINEEEYRLVLHAQMPVDSLGRLWTIGVDSGKWYRLDEGAWVEDIPPLTLFMMVPEETLKQLERQDEAKFNQAMANLRSKQPVQPRSPVQPPPPPQAVTPPSPVEIKEPARTPEISGAVACGKCGAINPPEAKFCTGCGQALSPSKPEKIICSKCNTQNPAEASFCMNCGNSLKEQV